MSAVDQLHYAATRITLVGGEPIAHPRAALYAAVNARGIMASGFAGAIRLAGGGEVERELLTRMPLLAGRAYLTTPGRLRERGVGVVALGVTHGEPGESPKLVPTREALADALEQLERARVRTMTLPEIGTLMPGLSLEDAARVLVDVLGTRLRVGSSLDEVVIASLHDAYLCACRDALLSIGGHR